MERWLARWAMVCGLTGLAFVLSASPPLARADEPPAPVEPAKVSLEALLDEARTRNPTIRGAKARWEAARRRILQASWLDDPMASYTYFGEEVQTRVGPQEQAFGVSQKVPFPTKLYYRGKAASEEAKAVREQYRAAELDVLTQVRQTYYELFWIRKAIEITEQDKALLENLEQVARAHFAAHAGRAQDVSKAQVEISRAIDRLLVLRQQAATVTTRLNALLNRSEETPVGPLEPFELPPLAYTREELQDLAAQHRQEVRAAEHRVKRDRAHVSLAKWRYVPDVTTGFNYVDIGSGSTTMPNDGDNAWNVMFTINVPIWEHSLWANLKEAKAKAASSKAGYEDARNRTAFEVDDAYFRWDTSRNLVDLYSSAIIPQAQQALDAAEAAYRAGAADFLNLLDSERVWLNAQLTYWRAHADAAKALAALERATGLELLLTAR